MTYIFEGIFKESSLNVSKQSGNGDEILYVELLLHDTN